MKLVWLVVCTLALCEPAVQGARILGIVVIPSKSHAILVGRLLKELASRGHDVTMVSAFSESKSYPNLTEVTVAGLIKAVEGRDPFARHKASALASLSLLTRVGLDLTEQLLSDPVLDQLKAAPRFDLILTEAFLSEAVSAGFAATHGAPIVAFGTNMPLPWVNYMSCNPTPYSYIPDPLLGFDTRMTLWERLSNAAFHIMAEMNHRLYYMPLQDALMRKFFGKDLPPLEDIVKNVSLVLINHHYSLAYPRPYTTNMIEVAGLHVDPPRRLPDDIKKLLDDSSEGAILFSMGSNLRSSAMPEGKLQIFLDAFARLKQKVIWKFEADALPGLPPNVLISKWLPQSDILAHPNLKVFITHGGLLSTTEAVHRGVPVVGIPIFGDQPINMRQAELAGFAVTVDFETITSDTLVNAVNKVLTDPMYLENVRRRSRLLHDAPLSPLDRAVYWVEHVLRHEGAPHLKSQARHLRWFELYMLDAWAVIITLVAAVFAVAVCSVKAFRKAAALLWFKTKTNKTEESKKTN